MLLGAGSAARAVGFGDTSSAIATQPPLPASDTGSLAALQPRQAASALAEIKK